MEEKKIRRPVGVLLSASIVTLYGLPAPFIIMLAFISGPGKGLVLLDAIMRLAMPALFGSLLCAGIGLFESQPWARLLARIAGTIYCGYFLFGVFENTLQHPAEDLWFNALFLALSGLMLAVVFYLRSPEAVNYFKAVNSADTDKD